MKLRHLVLLGVLVGSSAACGDDPITDPSSGIDSIINADTGGDLATSGDIAGDPDAGAVVSVPSCSTATDCAVGPCATDVLCIEQVCVPVLASDGSACDDGDVCTLGETCKQGVCGGGKDACPCKFKADCTALDDGDACNGTLRCVPDGGSGHCEVDPATVIQCPDDDTCQAFACESATGKCVASPITDGALCDDGQPCTVDTTCAAGKCVAGGTICVCQVSADCAPFEDGNACNGTLYCDTSSAPWGCKVNPATVVQCDVAGQTPCLQNACDPASGACELTPLADGAACEDGSACTSGDSCVEEQCVPGTNICPCAADADCAAKEDGDLCSGTLFCNLALAKPACQVNPATVVSCPKLGDGNCTATACASKTGKCYAAPMPENLPCDDDNPCTQGEVCKKGSCEGATNTCECKTTADCAAKEDGNFCNGVLYCDTSEQPFRCKVNPTTKITCASGQDTACLRNTCTPKTGACAMQPINNNGPCDADGNPCTVGDSCNKGLCEVGTNTCMCEANADCAPFEDGDLCNGTLYCDLLASPKICKVNPKTVVTCPDGGDSTCMENRCAPLAGICKMEPVHQGWPCNADDNACTADDACDLGECVTGTNLCACTKDSDCADSEDGDLCNGTLYCDTSAQPFVCRINPTTPVICPGGDSDACQANLCDPAKGTCALQPKEDNLLCNDGDPCTAGDVCLSGKCNPGAAVCACKQDADCAIFEDGDLCNGTLRCETGKFPHVCVIDQATIAACPKDDEPCADLVCNPANGSCWLATQPILAGKKCDDGDPCTTGDSCNEGICVGGKGKACDDGNPCTNDGCKSGAGCAHEANQAPCSDGLSCTVGDGCTGGKCVAGKAKVCDDGNPCTIDTCLKNSGKCSTKAQAGSCDDGNACTSSDACKAGGCVGTSVKCEDGNPCTKHTCDTDKGCLQSPASASCSDGSACTVGDTCSGGKCVPGKPTSCDDGKLCTTDACDKLKGCVHSPSTAKCDDGNPCTAGDTCKAGACQAGGNICGCEKDADCKAKEDGNVCNGTLRCDKAKAPFVCVVDLKTIVTCSAAKNSTCRVNTCDAKTGKCKLLPRNEGKSCDADGSVCTAADTCYLGLCKPGKSLLCNDGQVCTADSCDKAKGCTFTASGGACDDGDKCTTNDGCKGGKCAPGAALGCNDKNACTTDQCKPLVGCSNVATTAPCDDGNTCTSGDACAAGSCVPGEAVKCDDGNPCTNDGCDIKSGCSHVANKQPCNDGNKCTIGDSCAASKCVAGKAKSCDDNNPCTDDSCGVKTGACSHGHNGKPCDDGTVCTKSDACGGGVCKGVAINCDDNNACTDDACDAVKGCTHGANTKPCDDGSKCTLTDTCKSGGCVGSGAPSCDDGNPCTNDGCDKAKGCTHAANSATCDDNNVCTSGDKCSGGSCQSGANQCACTKNSDCAAKEDGNPCNGTLICDTSKAPYACKIDPKTIVTCDSSQNTTCVVNVCIAKTGACKLSAKNTGNPCSDGSKCTVGDLCKGGACDPGSAADCSDGNPCTTDSCKAAIGCVNTVNVSPCNDGNACTTKDTCSVGKCVGGQAPVCDDGKVCTTDSCDKAKGCVTANNTAPCDDGSKCTTVDVCAGGSCSGSKPPNCDDGNGCTTDSCSKAAGCVYSNNSASCDDGSKCTLNDACSGGACKGGPAPNCGDGKVCTTDSCDPAKGCQHVNNTAACDDGDGCTTTDGCKGGTCVGSGAPSCNDGKVCTTDSCDKAKGCVHVNNTAACDDADACTTADTCSGGNCVGGKAPYCNDGNVCTTDSCDKATGCKQVNNTATCDDGDACTASDACSGGTCGGKKVTCDDGNTCTDDVCDKAKGCVFTNHTKACDDGNVCTQIDACNGGKCVGNSPKTCDDKNACTTDSCDVVKGCQFANNTASCDDGDACTVGDACSAGACASGKPKICSDGNSCTADSCDKANGGCKYTALAGACEDGNVCSAGGVCSSGKCATLNKPRLFSTFSSHSSRRWGRDIVTTADGFTLVGGGSGEDGNARLIHLDRAGTQKWAVDLSNGEDQEHGFGLVQLSDGGYAITGFSESLGDEDPVLMVMRVNASGGKIWSKGHVTGEITSRGHAVALRDDGALFAVGYIATGSTDGLTVAFSNSGNKLFSRTWGYSGKVDRAHDVVALPDGFAIIGESEAGISKSRDMILLRTDRDGRERWRRYYGGSDQEWGYGLARFPDGGFALAGATKSFGAGGIDGWLLRVDAAGGVRWSKTVGGNGDDNLRGVRLGVGDNVFAVGTYKDGDLGKEDGYVVSTDLHGTTRWTQYVGGASEDWGWDLSLAHDGAPAVVTTSKSQPGNSNEEIHVARLDAWGHITCDVSSGCADKSASDCDDGKDCLLDGCDKGVCSHADATGDCADGDACSLPGTCFANGVCQASKQDKLLSKLYGVSGDDVLHGVTRDGGGLVAVGSTTSKGAGGADAWLLRVNSAGTITQEKTWGGAKDDVAWGVIAAAKAGHLVFGSKNLDAAKGKAMWWAKVNADGTLAFDKSKEGDKDEEAFAAAWRAPDKHLLVGRTNSKGGGGYDAYVLRISDIGNSDFDKTFGGTGDQAARGVVTHGTNGIVVGDTTQGAGGTDCLVFNVTSSGTQSWLKTFGGAQNDGCLAALSDGDNGVYAAGYFHDVAGGNKKVGSVWRINGSGSLLWQAKVTGANDNLLLALAPAAPLGVFAVGHQNPGPGGGMDALLAHIDAQGNVRSAATIGVSGTDVAHGVALFKEGLALVGKRPDSGNKAAGWLQRLDAWGTTKCTASGACADKPSVGCDDANPCTLDTCTAAAGCKHGNLADNSPCGGGKTCSAGVCK